jgi:hypothetical protein
LIHSFRATCAALLIGAACGSAFAQPRPAESDRPFEIIDNSFLVEEAFNQEEKIVQNIFSFIRASDSGWQAVFTQEWPLGTRMHQFSYTIPFGGESGATGLGDIMINYRFQALRETASQPALAPRLSVILPSGNERSGLGNGVVGWQVNLPFSKQRGDFYFHWNGGLTYLPGVLTPAADAGSESTSDRVYLLTPHLAGSALWRARPMFNLMLEGFLEFAELAGLAGTTTRETRFTLSPGARGGWNLGTHQLIVGAAVPLTFAESAGDIALLGYFSYELPFKR